MTRQASSGRLQLYVDGQLDAQAASSGATGEISYRVGRSTQYPNSDPFLVLAAEKHDAGSGFPSFNGSLDELRLSTTIRYNGNFTRPAGPFTADADTAALYHFDEGSGTTLGVIGQSQTGTLSFNYFVDPSTPDGTSIPITTTAYWSNSGTQNGSDFTFPDRVARRPERYAMPTGKSAADVKAELESVLASELSARKFSYTRSDGSSWTLSVKDVVDRVAALEMAYNVNDCVELRWGAADKSEEASTCKRRASSAQRAKMTEYRAWFHERRRPPRS